MRIHRASIACVILLQGACSGRSAPAVSDASPPRPAGELTLTFGPAPTDTIVVHPDGSFDLVSPQVSSMSACGGVCPRTVARFTVRGDAILQGSREVLTRGADGSVDLLGFARVTIDDDGALVESGQRYALDANGRYPHVDGQPDVTVRGATTPALRRRAALVLVFVGVATLGSVIDLASH